VFTLVRSASVSTRHEADAPGVRLGRIYTGNELLNQAHTDALARAVSGLRSAGTSSLPKPRCKLAAPTATSTWSPASPAYPKNSSAAAMPKPTGDQAELNAADAGLAALEETRTALRIRAERSEADLDAARPETTGH
jgi:hypothetical protein